MQHRASVGLCLVPIRPKFWFGLTGSFASVGAGPNSRSRASCPPARSQTPTLRCRLVRRRWSRCRVSGETRIGSGTRRNIKTHNNTWSNNRTTKLHGGTRIHREREKALNGLPARDHCGESDPQKGEAKGVPTPVPLCPPAWRTSAKKGGVALTTSTPPVRHAVTPGEEGDARGAASIRFPAVGAGNPCCPVSDAGFRESP